MTDSQQNLGSQPASNLPQSPQPPIPPQPPVKNAANGFGLAALIIGIVALLGAFIPFVNYGSGLLAVVGLVLGIIALNRKGKSKPIALGGVIASALALVLSIILAIVYTISFVNAVDDSLPKISATEAPAASDSTDSGSSEEPASDAVGTRNNPAPLGTVIETTSGGAPEYEITLGPSNLNAGEILAAENQFNEAAPAGLQYAMLTVTVTYKGSETGTPWLDLTIEFVSAAGTTHTTSDVFVSEPTPLTDVNELYTDASGTGNVAIAIPTADAEKGTWVVSSTFGGDKYYSAAQ